MNAGTFTRRGVLARINQYHARIYFIALPHYYLSPLLRVARWIDHLWVEQHQAIQAQQCDSNSPSLELLQSVRTFCISIYYNGEVIDFVPYAFAADESTD